MAYGFWMSTSKDDASRWHFDGPPKKFCKGEFW